MRTNSAMAASSFPCRISFSALRSVTARSMGTESVVSRGRQPATVRLAGHLVHRIKQRRGPERAAVHIRVTKTRHRFQVIGGRVPLVAIEPVARVAAVKLAHLAI